MSSRAGRGWSRSRRPSVTSGSGPSGSAPTPTSRCCSCTAARVRPTSSTSASTSASPAPGIEYYYYDQLGSFRSDQPDDPSLWELERFVDEVEQVRQALGLDATTSCCSGSRGAGSSPWSTPCTTRSILKGLVISNMMSSARLYNAYADDVLMPAHGSGRARRDQELRGRRHDRRPAVRAVADGAPLRPARLPHAVRTSGRTPSPAP